MLRYAIMALFFFCSLFVNSAQAQEVATAFRYPITTNGLNQGSSYTISQGYRNSDGHDGIDFAYSCGEPVYAVADGTVVASAEYGTDTDGDGASDSSWGNLVRIRHLMPDGSYPYSQYAHLTSRWVSYGDPVSYGQQIGTVGTTGHSTGCHLHFMIITTDMSGCGYYPSSTCGLDWSEEQYWSTFIDPIDFLDDHLGTSTTSTTHLMTIELQNKVESNGDRKYTIYGYEVSGSGDATTLSGNYFSYSNTGSSNSNLTWLSGDVNGDGWDDVVQVRIKDGSTYAHVYTSTGTGKLNTRARWKKTSGTASYAFLVDMNNDDRADLILAFSNGSSYTWKYCTSTGTGFNRATDWSPAFGSSTSLVLVGDFDGNGNGEVLAGTTNSGGFELDWKRLNDDGNSTTIATGWGSRNNTYIVSDINSDGRDDFLRIDETDNTVEAYLAQYDSSSTWLTVTPMAADVGGTDGQYFVYPLDYMDGYPDLLRFNSSGTLYLGQHTSATTFEEQNNQKTLVSGLNPEAILLFGTFGVRNSMTPHAIDGDLVDSADDIDTTFFHRSSTDVTTQVAMEYIDLPGNPHGSIAPTTGALQITITGVNGRINEATFNEVWSSVDQTTQAAVEYAMPGTSPSGFSDPITGVRYIVFQGSNRRIQLFIITPRGVQSLDLTSQAPVDYSDPTASPIGYVHPHTGMIHVLFTSTTGRIFELISSDGGTTWTSLDLSGLAAVENAAPGTHPAH